MSEKMNCIVCQQSMVRIERPPHLPQDDLACDNRDCTMFTVVLPSATVQRLSDAMALARAVERLEARRAYVNRWQSSDVWFAGVRPGYSLTAPTLAAALIALAEQIEDTP